LPCAALLAASAPKKASATRIANPNLFITSSFHPHIAGSKKSGRRIVRDSNPTFRLPPIARPEPQPNSIQCPHRDIQKSLSSQAHPLHKPPPACIFNRNKGRDP